MKSRAYLLFLILLMALSSTMFAKPSFVPGQLIFRKKSVSSLQLAQTSSIETTIQKLGGVIKKISISRSGSPLQLRGSLSENETFLVTFSPSENLDVLQKKLRQSKDIQWVQKNYRFTLFYTPNDPGISQQWHIPAVHLKEAWEESKGNRNIIIAIIDSGVAYTHPDLKNRMWTNPFVTDSSDSDGNDQLNDKIGWDFGSNDNNPLDNVGHGTMVAGIAAAQTDNLEGGAGAAFNATILPIKVTDDSQNIDTVAVSLAVNYAAFHKADVINISLGGPEENGGEDRLFEEAVNNAIDQGCTIVVAAGNISGAEATDIDEDHLIPATYPRVITVGGANQLGDYDSEVSLFGDSVDIIAPDTLIFSTSYRPSARIHDYQLGDGTSFAAPIVSGVVALMKAKNPGATPEEIQQTLKDSAEDKGATGKDKFTGYGLLDAENALELLAVGPTITFSNALSVYYSSPSTVTVTIKDSNGVSLNTISVTINAGLVTERYSVGESGITFSNSILTIPSSLFNHFLDTTLMTITVGALDGKSLYNSKTLTLQKADTLSVLTLLNSPNPFDPKRETTTFHIELSQDADVSMTLYSLGLQKIKEFPTQSLQAGYHMDTTWDGKDENGTVVPNGVYVLLFKAVGSGQTSIRRYKVAVLRR